MIDVHFHVVNKGTGVKNGDVSDEMIDKQIEVLNDAYKGTGYSFRLKTVDRTTNKQWYTAEPDTSAERQMKEALHQGEADDLNIYTTNPGDGLLGWATFPFWQKEDPKMDGVVLLASSLPGGSGAPFNEGDTATHEVGHWMGLFHTFQQPGDEVDDTPAHPPPNYGKPPESTDTDPRSPGNDPVHNYMNYTDDDWMWEFTPGQDARMDAQWELFHREDRGGADPRAHSRSRARSRRRSRPRGRTRGPTPTRGTTPPTARRRASSAGSRSVQPCSAARSSALLPLVCPSASGARHAVGIEPVANARAPASFEAARGRPALLRAAPFPASRASSPAEPPRRTRARLRSAPPGRRTSAAAVAADAD